MRQSHCLSCHVTVKTACLHHNRKYNFVTVFGGNNNFLNQLQLQGHSLFNWHSRLLSFYCKYDNFYLLYITISGGSGILYCYWTRYRQRKSEININNTDHNNEFNVREMTSRSMGSSKLLIGQQTTRAIRVSAPSRYDMHNKQLVHIALSWQPVCTRTLYCVHFAR